MKGKNHKLPAKDNARKMFVHTTNNDRLWDHSLYRSEGLESNRQVTTIF